MVHRGRGSGNANLIRTAREVNDGKPAYVVGKIGQAVAEAPQDSSIVVLGLSFKPDIDDLRESPALGIAVTVGKQYPSRRVVVVEPNIDALPPVLAELGNVELVSLEQAGEGAGVVALLVDHTPFRSADWDALGLGEAAWVDTRGVRR